MEGPIVYSNNVNQYDRGNHWEVVIRLPKDQQKNDQILPFPDVCISAEEAARAPVIEHSKRVNIRYLLPRAQTMPTNFSCFNK